MKNRLRLHLWISHGITAIAVVLAVTGVSLRQEGEGVHYLVWIAVALMIAAVFYKIITIKCPHCGAFLPVRYKLPQTCPACNRSVLKEVETHEEMEA